MDNAGQSQPGSGSDRIGGRNSEEEEEVYVEEHVRRLKEFLEHLKERGKDLPPKAKEQYKGLKLFLQDMMGQNAPNEGGATIAGLDGVNHAWQGPSNNSNRRNTEQSGSSSSEPEDLDEPARGEGTKRDHGVRFKRSLKTEASTSESGSGSTQVRHSRVTRSHHQRRRKTSGKPDVTQEIMQRMIAGVDTRSVPDQAPFNERSGEDLQKYLDKFEDYCTSRYKGSRDLWIGELERHLTGKTLEGFRALRDAHDTYDRAKAKLLEWHSRSARERKEEHKREFQEARYRRQDGIYLQGVRLERMFRVAYPNRDVETSKRLRDKFIHTMPENVSRMCRQHVTDQQAQGRRVTWTQIQNYAKECANCLRESSAREEGGNQDEEIVIHVGQDARSETKDSNRWSRNFYSSKQGSPERGREGPRTDRRPKMPYSSTQQPSFPPDWKDRSTLKKCFHCGRLGHLARGCRRRLGLCFGCGSSGHMLSGCPNFQASQRQRFRGQSVPPNARQVQRGNRRARSNSRGPSANQQANLDARVRPPTRPLNDAALP